jgi:hypothetical protein
MPMRLILVALALVPLVSCGGGGDSIAPSGPGSLELTTTTNGPQADADGYAISVDGVDQGAIGVDATLQLGNIEPGQHAVQLAGLAPNCTVTGENPRTVTVTSRESTAVSFQITCLATAGGLDIVVITTGSSLDPDGYVLALDGKDRLRLDVNGAVTFDALTPGSHLVGLSDIAANCQIQGDNPRPVVVAGGTTRNTTLRIGCT